MFSIIYKKKKQQKKSPKIDTKTCQKKKKTRLKSTKDNDISNWFSTKKKHYKINEFCFCLVSKWVKRLLAILELTKKFHKSKQPIDLDLVNVNQIVVSKKFKHSDGGLKSFIGYKEGEIVRPLCINLPEMTGYIKYFENRRKNMSFIIKDDNVPDKFNEN